MANNKKLLANTLENIQLKIMEYSLEEAKAKMEKAQVELETAKLQREHVQKFIMMNAPSAGGVS